MFSFLPKQIPCTATQDGTTLACLVPPVDTSLEILLYSLMFDDTIITNSDLTITVRPDPSDFTLVNDKPIVIGSKSAIMQVQVRQSNHFS